MADIVTVNQQFLDWLKATPAALAKFLQLVMDFYNVTQQTTPMDPPPAVVPEGPIYVRPDQPPTLITVPLTTAELDAMMEDRADAQVIEKAVEFLKGFLTGLVVAAVA